MNKWLLGGLPLAVLLAIGLLFAFAIGRGTPERKSALLGKPAPAFALPAIKGLSLPGVSRADLGNGRPVLVTFWASWCVPCEVEQPALTALAKASGVELVGIDYKDTDENARAFLARAAYPFSRIGADTDGRAAFEWGVSQVPETFYIGADGRILGHIGGPLDERTVNRWSKGEPR